jgi:tetratricopeptide (TPR) repeat protein
MNDPVLGSPSPAVAAALDLALQGELAGAVEALAKLATPGAPDPQRTEVALALARIASDAEGAGELELAERALAGAVEARATFADLHCRRARLLARLDRRIDARRALERALKINPQYLEARLERAMMDAREGQVGEALEALRRIAREFPVKEPQAFQRGVRDLERAEWEEAGSLLRCALAVDDEEMARSVAEARDALERGEIAAAIEATRRMLGRHPAYPDLHALLGAAELQRGHHEDAMSALARALELNPEFHDARALFARALEAQGAFAAAADQAALVLERVPDHAGAREIQERWARRPKSHLPARLIGS